CSDAMPQMPCPAVQPLDRRAPKPAMNPPASSRHAGTPVTKGSPQQAIQMNAPATSAAAYTSRHWRDETKRPSWKNGAREKYDHTLVNTVLMPPMSPVETKRRLIPAPMITPPARYS